MLPAVMSSNGAWQFVYSIFGDLTDKLLYEGYERDVLAGVREAQFVLNTSNLDLQGIKNEIYAAVGRTALTTSMRAGRYEGGDGLPAHYEDMQANHGGDNACAFYYRGEVE